MPGVLEEGRGARLVMVWFSFLMLLQLLARLEAGRGFEVLWPLTGAFVTKHPTPAHLIGLPASSPASALRRSPSPGASG